MYSHVLSLEQHIDITWVCILFLCKLVCVSISSAITCSKRDLDSWLFPGILITFSEDTREILLSLGSVCRYGFIIIEF